MNNIQPLNTDRDHCAPTGGCAGRRGSRPLFPQGRCREQVPQGKRLRQRPLRAVRPAADTRGCDVPKDVAHAAHEHCQRMGEGIGRTEKLYRERARRIEQRLREFQQLSYIPLRRFRGIVQGEYGEEEMNNPRPPSSAPTAPRRTASSFRPTA